MKMNAVKVKYEGDGNENLRKGLYISVGLLFTLFCYSSGTSENCYF